MSDVGVRLFVTGIAGLKGLVMLYLMVACAVQGQWWQASIATAVCAVFLVQRELLMHVYHWRYGA
jgi:hypothetical protein